MIIERNSEFLLEFPLLSNNTEKGSWNLEDHVKGCCDTAEPIEELKKQLELAGPLVLASFLQYFLQMISIMFIGHLGEIPLSSATLATSFAGVTGFSFMLGMGSALETLCGQAYGAKQYHMFGIHMQRVPTEVPANTKQTQTTGDQYWFYEFNSCVVVLGTGFQIGNGKKKGLRSVMPYLIGSMC
ncbi:hypothetical protein K7X08_024614 [Anisodus acutangulus]|uniref:Multi antimicrobial extrusion protein n=1 Tax=Anisodus acutangulus TaxID=402998 RepID=A0A9Q1M8Q7_9SOLA|nr:hypothetical protein K7X08_024614 [Anisodus acutangulus]